MVVISVSLSGEELAEFDKLVAHFGYDSRSGAVRDALYHFIARHRLDLAEEADVVLTLVYEAEKHQDELHGITHANADLIRTSLHSHMGKRCVDFLVAHGTGRRIHDLLDQFTRIKDVRVTITPL